MDQKRTGPPSMPLATHIAVEARMPHPSIVLPEGDLPLRISCTVLQGDDSGLALDFVRIHLISLLEMRAQGSKSVHTSNSLLLEAKHVRTPLIFTGARKRTCPLDEQLWQLARIPTPLTPSFETCNITQRYELHIVVGIMQRTPTGHVSRSRPVLSR